MRGSVNLILGSHAFRRVQKTRAVMQNLSSALAPGGFLLLNELVGPLGACLWGLQSPAESPCGSLGWSSESWKEALESVGFAEVSTIR